ncbi:hypothetical protein EGH82_11100 [Vibrio ponticus]|uniref:Uncharacterized protein n=1 Tax=Vibrio ponticus TaxID=265668 RepID=A0A3N3DZV5_9VIBR|nr:RbsD/FucU domain-containing protein [Vibrio ponticus]ROV60001.1 hypothetical protein EGH82_11100 [Vibrio ponticus]
MLKHIDPLLNAELLFALQNMGHGDRLAIVDANFPAKSHAKGTLISLPGVNASNTLESILKHMPLDAFTEVPMWIMAEDGKTSLTEAALDFVRVKDASEESQYQTTLIDRQDFYIATQACELVISTNDLRPYACMILQKGVIFD